MWILVLVSFLVRIVFMLVFVFILIKVGKLAEDNSFVYRETEGKTAEVYLKIPAFKSGKVKLLIRIKEYMLELESYTKGDAIETRTLVIKTIQNYYLLKNKFTVIQDYVFLDLKQILLKPILCSNFELRN